MPLPKKVWKIDISENSIPKCFCQTLLVLLSNNGSRKSQSNAVSMRCHPSISGHIRFSANEQRDQHCINVLSTPHRRLILGILVRKTQLCIPNIPCEIHCKYLQCMGTTHPYLPFPVPGPPAKSPTVPPHSHPSPHRAANARCDHCAAAPLWCCAGLRAR